MTEYKISNKGTDTLFNNRILEALTRTNFIFPVILFLLVAVSVASYAIYIDVPGLIQMVWLIPAGLILFSLVEYLMHRFLFHFHAENEKQQEIKYKMHGVHHAYPRDKDRLAMPPILSICLALLFYGLFRLLFGETALLIYPGFIAGYSIYLIIHYAVHRYKPPRNFLKILWTHHALHHYKDDNSSFGVSMPLWDYVFRTLPERK